MRSCYMCSSPATSDEHAPPKCLFPERKDVIDGVDHRKNLITVPACDKHNSAKSHDDEYLLQCLAASYTSSVVGLTQFLTKVQRAFLRSPGKAAAFTRKSDPVQLRRVTGDSWENGLQVTIQGERIDEVLANAARALYFHETGKKFLGPAHVKTDFTMYNHAETQAKVTEAFRITSAYFETAPRHGENPDVFWYKFEEGQATAMFLFCFYSDSMALVRFSKIIVPGGARDA